MLKLIRCILIYRPFNKIDPITGSINIRVYKYLRDNYRDFRP